MISTQRWWLIVLWTIVGGAAGLLLVPVGLLVGLFASSEGIEALLYGYAGAIVGPLIGAIWAAYSMPSARGSDGRRPATVISAAFSIGLGVGAWIEYSTGEPLLAEAAFPLAFAGPWASGASIVLLCVGLRHAAALLWRSRAIDGRKRAP